MWRLDEQMDAWMNGTFGITYEVLDRFPREQVQQLAVRMTGQPLPESAFGPPAALIVTVAGMEMLSKALADDAPPAHGVP